MRFKVGTRAGGSIVHTRTVTIFFPVFARARQTGWRRILRWQVLVAATFLYLFAHLQIGRELAVQTNQDPARSDQANNMQCARIAAERAVASPAKGIANNIRDWLPHYTDGVINPLWPRVAASLDDDGDDTAFFTRGKAWNILFTGIFLVVMAWCLGVVWPVPAVLLFLLVAGLGAFLPRSSWFQPEPLYYALFLLSWMIAIALLRRNPIWLYGLFGLTTGLAYLAKASVQPMLLVFVAVSTLRFLAAAWPARRREDGSESRSGWSSSAHFIGMSVLVCVHLVVIAPRLAYARQTFGSPLHAYPSYWMWMDDFEQGYAWMGAHNTKESLLAVPPAEVPSARRWLAEHDRSAAWHRLADGSWWQVRRLLESTPTPRDKQGKIKTAWKAVLERPGWTLAMLLVLTGAAAVSAIALRRADKLPVHRQEPERGMVLLFVFGCLAFYTMLHGWYTPVGDGDRFMLALWAPLAYSLIGAGESIMARLEARRAPEVIVLAYRLAQSVVVCLLVWRIIELLTNLKFA